MTSISIPEGVTFIGDYAFYNCTYVTELRYDVAAKLSSMYAERIFGNIGKFTDGVTVTFGENVVSVPKYMFATYDDEIYNIKNVVLYGTALEKIGEKAFYSCDSLESATYIGCLKLWNTVDVESGNDLLLPTLSMQFVHGVDVSVVCQEATCEQEGYIIKICNGCGTLIEDKSIPKLGHQFDDGDTCALCGKAKSDIIVYGDANDDGRINSSDITRLLRYLANRDPMTGESSVVIGYGADCNGDGKISSTDVTRLLRYLANRDPMTGESSIVLGPTN